MKKNNAASELAHLRWKHTPKAIRGQFVGHQGGRPPVYPPCPERDCHRFYPKDTCCWCGYRRGRIRAAKRTLAHD